MRFIYLIILTVLLLTIILINKTYEPFVSIKNPDIIIVTTLLGKAYAKRISSEIKKINNSLTVSILNIKELNERCDKIGNPKLIIVRAATPIDTDWIKCLTKMEKRGIKVVNPTSVLKLTSNKLLSSFHFIKKGLPHQDSKEGSKLKIPMTLNTIRHMLKFYNKIIIKPFTSRSQGIYVRVITKDMTDTEIISKINQIPTNQFVIQEFIPYKAIYRVIVINNKALPLSYKDIPRPNKWRVSVCLNKNMKFIPNPPKKLLQTAERVQSSIYNGGVHFIDLFEVNENKYVISEVNTACRLLLHERKAREAKHKYHNIAHYLAQYYVSLVSPMKATKI